MAMDDDNLRPWWTDASSFDRYAGYPNNWLLAAIGLGKGADAIMHAYLEAAETLFENLPAMDTNRMGPQDVIELAERMSALS